MNKEKKPKVLSSGRVLSEAMKKHIAKMKAKTWGERIAKKK